MNIQRCVFLLAASSLASVATAQQASDPPPVQHTPLPDLTYELSVTSADGVQIRDCATFGVDHALVLLQGKGLVIDWLYETTDPSGRKFHAVTDGSRMASNPIGLAIHGTFVGSDAIRGDMINELGLTFSFRGRLNRGCYPGVAAYPVQTPSVDAYPEDNPYAAAPATQVLFEPEPGSVAGKLYAVSLYSVAQGEARPAEVSEDCFRFVTDGSLRTSSGRIMAWGMDRLNGRLGTFQAAGPNASAGAGRALRGELSAWGELRVHGIESDARGFREIVGSGRETAACID
jgi:hypothetical protein